MERLLNIGVAFYKTVFVAWGSPLVLVKIY